MSMTLSHLISHESPKTHWVDSVTSNVPGISDAHVPQTYCSSSFWSSRYNADIPGVTATLFIFTVSGSFGLSEVDVTVT